jgi:hypothetical protein
MDWKAFKRNPAKVRSAVQVQPDKSVVALRGVRIYVPERYLEKELADISSETYIVGIYAMVTDDGFYAVSRINAMMRICPTAINTVKFDQDSYLEFLFEPGSVVLATTDLVASETLVYQIFDEFVAKGKLPWFLDYDDRARLFESADKHAGVNLGKSHAILAMITAATTRQQDDRARYYRHNLANSIPVTIPLRSITYGTTNTTSKLVGAQWGDAVDSALVTPAEKVEKVEELLRR